MKQLVYETVLETEEDLIARITVAAGNITDIQDVKNNVYNVSGMIEEVKTNKFFIWQNFGLCTVFQLDGLRVDGLTSVTTRTY